MITHEDCAAIDNKYFQVIEIREYSITLRSRNTGHCWHLLERIANGCTTYVISHRHGSSGPFHLQRSRPTVEACCDYIMDHDRYHLEKTLRQKEQRLKRLGLLPADGHARHNKK